MDEELESVVEYLHAWSEAWITAKEIQAVTNVSPSDMRALCQEYPDVFVSSQHGYKLVENASSSEIRDCVQSLIGRAAKITSRASALAGRLS